MVKFKFWKKEVKPKPDTSTLNESEEKEYQYPKMDSSGTGNLYEETAIKPTRHDEA